MPRSQGVSLLYFSPLGRQRLPPKRPQLVAPDRGILAFIHLEVTATETTSYRPPPLVVRGGTGIGSRGSRSSLMAAL